MTKEEREGKPEDTFTALPSMNPRKRSERLLRRIREEQKLKGEDEGEEDDLEIVIEEAEVDTEMSVLDQDIFGVERDVNVVASQAE